MNQKYLDQNGNLTDEYYGYVYCIYNQFDKKVYIGQTKNRIDKKYYGSGIIIRRIVKKYGTYFLKKIILGVCYSREEILECELECKLFFNAFNPLYGYNIAKNDTGGDLLSYHPNKEEIYKKISIIHKGRLSFFKGHHHTEESKLKLSIAHKGKKLSEKHKKKMSIHFSNLIRTEEHCKHISESLMGHEVKEETREKLRVFNSRSYVEKFGEERAKEIIEKRNNTRRLKGIKKACKLKDEHIPIISGMLKKAIRKPIIAKELNVSEETLRKFTNKHNLNI